MDSQIQKDNVLTSKHFCMLPWVHLHFLPDSTAHYCCVSDATKPVAKYDGDISKIYNAETIKSIRLNMLKDEPSSPCNRCYELERNKVLSLRQSSNRSYLKYFDEAAKTNDDGSVNEFTMRYLDIRFSNKCNLRCRSCGPFYSSGWYADQIKMFPSLANTPALSEVGPKDLFWKDLLPSLGHIEEAYFAGGEPLVTDEVFDIMDHWLATNNTNVQIGFTTNFTNLGYRAKSITEYWKKFPKLIVSASLDDSGERAEYLRKGTKWSKVVENRQRMLERCPAVVFEITPTISVFNIWHFPEFHYEWLKAGLLKTEDLRLNILTHPDYMSFKIIHPKKRIPLILKWMEYLDLIIEELQISVHHYNKTVEGYRSIIHALKNDPYVDLRKEFFERNDLVDKTREENLYAVYPELKELLAD